MNTKRKKFIFKFWFDKAMALLGILLLLIIILDMIFSMVALFKAHYGTLSDFDRFYLKINDQALKMWASNW